MPETTPATPVVEHDDQTGTDSATRAVIADALVRLRVHVFLSDEDDDNDGVLAAMKLLRPLITEQDWVDAADRAAPHRINRAAQS